MSLLFFEIEIRPFPENSTGVSNGKLPFSGFAVLGFDVPPPLERNTARFSVNKPCLLSDNGFSRLIFTQMRPSFSKQPILLAFAL